MLVIKAMVAITGSNLDGSLPRKGEEGVKNVPKPFMRIINKYCTQRVSPNGPQTSKTHGVLFYLDLTGRISVATTQVSDPIPILKAAV